MPSQKVIIGFLLVSISVVYFSLSLSLYERNKEEIIFYLAEVVEEIALPFRIAELSAQSRDTEIIMPIKDVFVRDISDTWGAARSEGRTHEGVDVFAERGAPLFSATDGYVIRTGVGDLGGNFVFVVGAGGIRYYYAHLDSIARGIERGTHVTTDTVLGFVGNTGNAETTPPHLHLGMYGPNGAENPYSLLVDRE